MPICPHGEWLRLIAGSLVAATLASCASRPPLPKHAAIETGGGPSATVDYAELVANADIVYFPAERAASGSRSEPAALLLDAFASSGAPFAIAWDCIVATDQPQLDQLPQQSGAAREKTIAEFELSGGGRAREHCRTVLGDPRIGNVRQIALKIPETPPPPVVHFKLPPGGLEAYAERLSAAESLSGRDVAADYRARVAAQQFAAEQIVRHFENGAGGKLLVFVAAADLESGQGVPFYVAQKLPLRQLVLGPKIERGGNVKLLTGDGFWSRRTALQIVDRTPAAVRD